MTPFMTRRELVVGSCWRSWLLSPGTFSLLALPVLMVGVGALVQGTKYSSIAMQPTASMITVSALLLIVSVVMLLGGIMHIAFISFSGTQNYHREVVTSAFIFSILYSLPVVVVALGITAAALIPSLSETTKLSANTTFNNYLSDQSVQKSFDNVQHNLKCCGVVAFTDYETIIFNNLSVQFLCLAV